MPEQRPTQRAACNWLLLRGLGREQGHWGPFPERLQSVLFSPQVQTLDLPGAGSENRRRAPFRIAGYTADLRRRWRALRGQNETPWALFGISLGGMIAADWTARYPNDFARCVLVNISSWETAWPWQRFNWRELPTLLRAMLPRQSAADQERWVLKVVSNQQAELDQVAERWGSIRRARPVSPQNFLRQLVAAGRFKTPAAWTTPTLVLSSGADRLVTKKASERIAARRRLPHRQHATGGHELALDDPDWICEQIRAWLTL